ncbi:MAG: hypothetical protein K6V36_01320 [Anaerolineae bacterium]|nr:hypothetical protein [Anaerolineae bacterium]
MDEALSRLMRGESLQVCLSTHPEMAGELLPFLLLAQRLRALAFGMPDPTPILAIGRVRFLQAASRLRARHTPDPRQSLRPGGEDSRS